MVDYSEDVKAAAAALEQGKIILYPTDTIWGIGCDATNAAAVERIFALKQRPIEKSMIVLIADARDVLQYVAAPPPDIIADMEAFDQPTTVVFDGALGLAENVINDDGSIGLRVPQDEFCRALIKRLGKPIVSTSANVSGTPAASVFSKIDQSIKDGVDYVVGYRQNEDEPRQASRVVKIDDYGQMTILRG